MSGETILFGMTADFEIHLMIEENLRYCGYQPINIAYNDHIFRYPSLWARLKTKWQKIVLGDIDAKWKLKARLHFANKVLPLIEGKKIDHAFFIRGDVYHIELLKRVKSTLSCDMVNYQWDGVERYPNFQKCLPLFDRCYVFDPADLQRSEYPFLPISNFYFDFFEDTPEIEYDFYFSGSHQISRTDLINRFIEFTEKNSYSIQFNMLMLDAAERRQARTFYPSKTINIIEKGYMFKENLHRARRAACLLDFLTPVHKGLSFRPFEALGYDKKLITTNAEVKKYDFYHPDNIFVWDGENTGGIAEFLEKPYQPIPAEIKEKYSFSNWIRYLLQMPPYQEIQLPQQ